MARIALRIADCEFIGVSLNTEKTRIVTITDERAAFAFLGFECRWVPSTKTGRWYPCMTPRPKKITALLQKVRDTLRKNRHVSVQAAVAQVKGIKHLRTRTDPTGSVRV